ncbi:mandelate racemase/muconate lactonizing enzyme family protein [Rhodococcus sp. IEGM 1330]|uniref:mandelate racemase/muconate lactonizing enzyme family protein n=1 Tax=Rhodococcus sp. IEGM 1330 TaxID=3082225 RepID=UPI002952FA03|nr:enolase C-terminal domain-like protein [Rhodococcus sp. IEGM 1330]MDV8022644.1 enolase C-terminal domain-like protein [Rhodococcus sp. IEGM 1330]
MRITAVSTAVRSVILQETQFRRGRPVAGTQDILFVRVETESGHVGFGEASSWAIFTGLTANASKVVVDEIIGPEITGLDVSRTHEIARALDRYPHLPAHPRSAVDMALADVNARILGVPTYRLLGGSDASWALSYSISEAEPDAVRSIAETRIGEGYRIFKLKAGSHPELDGARISALRHAAPKAAIRVDFNGSATEAGLRELSPVLQTCDVDFVEQPYPAGQWGRMRSTRAWFESRIALDESIGGEDDVRRVGEDGLADIIALKLGRFGSSSRLIEAGTLAARLGMSIYAGAMNESRLGMSASAATFSTLDNIVEGCDFYYPYTVLGEPGFTGGAEVVDAELRLGSDAGHGIDLPMGWFV